MECRGLCCGDTMQGPPAPTLIPLPQGLLSSLQCVSLSALPLLPSGQPVMRAQQAEPRGPFCVGKPGTRFPDTQTIRTEAVLKSALLPFYRQGN